MHLNAVYNMAAILNRLQRVNMEWVHLADAIIQKNGPLWWHMAL